MPTYRLTLEYEGTRYRGWQEQQNARSVAGELRRAIVEAAGEVGDLGASGRTDAGVHALAQVAHLRVARAVEPEPFRRAVNDRLPPDIHLLAVAPAAHAFHARHDAVERSYVYQVSRRRTALAKRFVWWVKEPLDAGRMARAAALLAGRHDFRLFCERPGEQPSTLVVVHGAEVVEAGALVLVRLVRLALPLEDGAPGGGGARARRQRSPRPHRLFSPPRGGGPARRRPPGRVDRPALGPLPRAGPLRGRPAPPPLAPAVAVPAEP